MTEEPVATFKIRGTITFPAREEIIRQIAEEVPTKPVPWGWIVAAGSLFITAIVCLSAK